MREALLLKPTLLAARFDSGLLLMEQADWCGAVESFEKILAKHPRHADGLCCLGNSLLESDDLEKSKRCFESALKINPDYIEAKKKLALIFYKLGKFKSAEKLIAESIELHQDYADLHKIRGDILLKRRELGGAEVAYRESLAINPAFEDATFGLVITLRRAGSAEEASRLLEDFIDKNPYNLVAKTLQTHHKMDMEDD